MRIKYLSLIAVALMLSMAGCKKSALDATPRSTSVDVYVAGEITNSNNKIEAVYWKNGDIVKLGDSESISQARGIVAKGSDVYVAGDITSADNSTISAVYWKNGVATKLDNVSNNSQAYGIAFQGADMYVVGGAYNSTLNAFQAVVWKNGVATPLSGGSIASAIAINGNDVYIAGVTGTGNNIAATVWKNGVPAALTGGLQANAVTVNGNDVYIAGNMANGAAGFWKNGVPTLLTNDAVANHSAYDITGIATNGTDVFVAGGTLFTDAADSFNANSWGSIATVWKNSVPVTLSAAPLNNTAASVFMYGNDVYVTTGGINNGPDSFAASYWKNGVAVQLSSGGSKGASPGRIIVVPRN